jgi:hypothetical protein
MRAMHAHENAVVAAQKLEVVHPQAADLRIRMKMQKSSSARMLGPVSGSVNALFCQPRFIHSLRR